MTDNQENNEESAPCDPGCRGPNNNYESHDFIDHYYEGEDCEESIKIGESDEVSFSHPLPFRPPHLPLHFRPIQALNSEYIALNNNVVIKMLSIGEIFSPNLSNQEYGEDKCVDNFQCGRSINSSATGVVVKGIVTSKGIKVPSDWPVMEGDFVAIKNYSTSFKKNHYVSVNYKSVLNKFNNEFPVALLDRVSVQIFSVSESKSDLLPMLEYDKSVNGAAKGIVISVGSKVPQPNRTILGSGGVFIISGAKSIFTRRYYTTLNYKLIKTKVS